MRTKRIFVVTFFLLTLIGSLICYSQSVKPPTAILENLKGAIGPVTADYVERGIKKAVSQKASLLILQIDTPGGLDTSMRSVISQIINSEIPIVSYVAPSGARAASAGTYIVYASHIAAMAPGTNLGAATPVSIGGNESESNKMTASEKKSLNDASAYIRSLAQLRHRNIAWGEKAVLSGASISATEALQMKVIDVVAVDLKDLMTQINGRTVQLKNRQQQLNTVNIKIENFNPDWRSQFLSIITDPNIAYILLLVGIYGLIFEFMNPGFVLPGVAGLICIFIALYAFQLLPINYAGLILIIIGMAFMVGEVLAPSFGALGIGGIIAFVIGSVMLMDTQNPGFKLLIPIIVAVTLVTVGFLVLLMQLVLRAHKKPIVSGKEELIGSIGKVIKAEGDEHRPRIRVRGELWQIESEYPLENGELVKVVDLDELILKVEPVQLNKDIET